MEKELLEKIKQMRKTSRLLKGETGLMKTFNHGRGSISFLTIRDNYLLVNGCFATPKNWSNIRQIFKGTGLQLVNIPLGYPDWYSETMLSMFRKQKCNYLEIL